VVVEVGPYPNAGTVLDDSDGFSLVAGELGSLCAAEARRSRTVCPSCRISSEAATT
jgi:hypothetical protein